MATDFVAGDTNTAVAYALFIDCLVASGKGGRHGPEAGVSEAAILDLFGRCLATVNGSLHNPHTGAGAR